MPRGNRTPVTKQIQKIRSSIRDLERSLTRLVPLARGIQAQAAANGRPRRKLTLTPKRRAELKLQGSYLGYMRQLKPQQKAKVRAARETKGIQAAIRVAKGMAGR